MALPTQLVKLAPVQFSFFTPEDENFCPRPIARLDHSEEEEIRGTSMSRYENAPLALEVSVGVPSEEEALKIGRILVEERLAGAANIIPGVTAFFWWDGVVKEKAEATLLLKTLPENFADLSKRVRELHSYITPGIKAWPVVAGDPEWLKWLQKEAQPENTASAA
jgi:periplasmic divalent cation tolerance protein